MEVLVIVDLSVDFLLFDLMLVRLDYLVGDSCNVVSMYIMYELSFDSLTLACA